MDDHCPGSHSPVSNTKFPYMWDFSSWGSVLLICFPQPSYQMILMTVLFLITNPHFRCDVYSYSDLPHKYGCPWVFNLPQLLEAVCQTRKSPDKSFSGIVSNL